MSWLAPVLLVTAAILHGLSASFLSTIDEYRRIDSPKAHKRFGRPNEPPNDARRIGYRADVDFEEGEDPSCDVVAAQCQCDGDGGGDGVEWNDGVASPKPRPPSPPVVPVPQVQKRRGAGPRKRQGTQHRKPHSEDENDADDLSEDQIPEREPIDDDDDDDDDDDEDDSENGEDVEMRVRKRQNVMPRKRQGNRHRRPHGFQEPPGASEHGRFENDTMVNDFYHDS